MKINTLIQILILIAFTMNGLAQERRTVIEPIKDIKYRQNEATWILECSTTAFPEVQDIPQSNIAIIIPMKYLVLFSFLYIKIL